METLINRFAEYVNNNLEISVLTQELRHTEELPFYLRQRYTFFQTELLSVNCILVLDSGIEEQTPAVIEKHFNYIAGISNDILIYIREAISSYDRKRLIERKIPFVVPGNQMYMPFLGIDLCEHFRRIQIKTDKLSPATQYLLMYLLQQPEDVGTNPYKASELLGYSRMTMTRAFQELKQFGIGVHKKTGKNTFLYLGESKRDIWATVLPYLQNPINRTIFLRRIMNDDAIQHIGKLAGLSALAKYTMIAEPRVPIYAIQSKHWTTKMQLGYQKLPYPDLNTFELELWRYPVHMPQQADTVDRLSLYLSLKDSADERVQGELPYILEGIIW